MKSSSLRVLPDFAIVGAPKCGTTSLHSALAAHPGVCMSSIKEPYFFATDFGSHRYIKDETSYRRLYAGDLNGKLCGEASVVLRSQVAIPAMLDRNPNLKVIAVVRDPIELFRSMHNENVRMRREDVLDLEEAWKLQDERARGLRIPAGCTEASILQYRYICALGEQIEFLFRVVPEKQRLVLVFDDLKTDSPGCMRQILRFLNLDDRIELPIPVTNAYSMPRSALVADLLKFLVTNPAMNQFQVRFRPMLNRFGMEQLKWLFDLNLAKVPKPPLRPGFREALVEEFRDDVALLSALLRRDFSIWPGFSTTFAPGTVSKSLQ